MAWNINNPSEKLVEQIIMMFPTTCNMRVERTISGLEERVVGV